MNATDVISALSIGAGPANVASDLKVVSSFSDAAASILGKQRGFSVSPSQDFIDYESTLSKIITSPNISNYTKSIIIIAGFAFQASHTDPRVPLTLDQFLNGGIVNGVTIPAFKNEEMQYWLGGTSFFHTGIKLSDIINDPNANKIFMSLYQDSKSVNIDSKDYGAQLNWILNAYKIVAPLNGVNPMESTVNNVAQPSQNSGAVNLDTQSVASTAMIQNWINTNPGITDLPPGLKYTNYAGVDYTTGLPKFTGGTAILNPNIPVGFGTSDSRFVELIKDLIFAPFLPIAKLKG